MQSPMTWRSAVQAGAGWHAGQACVGGHHSDSNNHHTLPPSAHKPIHPHTHTNSCKQTQTCTDTLPQYASTALTRHLSHLHSRPSMPSSRKQTPACPPDSCGGSAATPSAACAPPPAVSVHAACLADCPVARVIAAAAAITSLLLLLPMAAAVATGAAAAVAAVGPARWMTSAVAAALPLPRQPQWPGTAAPAAQSSA